MSWKLINSKTLSLYDWRGVRFNINTQFRRKTKALIRGPFFTPQRAIQVQLQQSKFWRSSLLPPKSPCGLARSFCFPQTDDLAKKSDENTTIFNGQLLSYMALWEMLQPAEAEMPCTSEIVYLIIPKERERSSFIFIPLPLVFPRIT